MSRRAVLEKFEKYAEETERRVAYGIEQYRKGNFKLKVLDAEGNPVKNAKIALSQTGHEFKFGANLFMLDELETEEKNEQYKQYFAGLFNMATLPFYWSGLEPEPGCWRYDKNSPKLYRRPAIDRCMEFCEKHGIEPREHALAYDYLYPTWSREMTVQELKQAYTARCREIASRYADKIPTIEVTNECEWGYDKSGALMNEDDYIEWSFLEAGRHFPNNQLVINEKTHVIWKDDLPRNRHAYYLQIERALNKGARIDAIGMQFHMFYPAEDELKRTAQTYSPRHQFAVMDRFADFRRPLQITEVTIPAYSQTAEDEEIQAELIRQLYRIWFSHERMEQIIYWNLPDGYAAYAPMGDFASGENYYRGGLLRFDMTPKPAYYAIRDLIQTEWHTETETTTDENGVAYFRGFYGDYSAKINGREAKLRAYKTLPIDSEYNKRVKPIVLE